MSIASKESNFRKVIENCSGRNGEDVCTLHRSTDLHKHMVYPEINSVRGKRHSFVVGRAILQVQHCLTLKSV